MRAVPFVLMAVLVAAGPGCKRTESAPAAATRSAPAAAGGAATTRQADDMLRGRIVLAEHPDQPVEGAKILGQFVSGSKPPMAVSDAQGNFEVPAAEQDGDFLVLTENRKLGAVVRLKQQDQDVTIAVAPTATAHGLLLDSEGKPLAGQRMMYGIMTMSPTALPSPIPGGRPVHTANAMFGGSAKTGPDGTFDLSGLVPGHEYAVSVISAGHMLFLPPIKPDSGGVIDLGDVHAKEPTTRRGQMIPRTRPGAPGDAQKDTHSPPGDAAAP
jgi:hypothetical protein